MKDLLPFLIVGLTSGSVYGLAATGLVLTYRTSGIFNFAHGTIAALAAFAFYDLRERQGLPWPLALVICVFGLGPLIGFVLEQIARRVSDVPVVMKVVATIGMVVALQQLLLIRYGGSTIFMHQYLPSRTFELSGVLIGVDQLIVMAVALGGTVLLSLLLARTRLGRSMRAVVDQPELLALTGTSPTTVRRRAWYIGTSFAGLSGVLLAPTVGLNTGILTLLVVQAFGAAAVGSFRSIPLTYVGGLVVGVTAALSTKYVATVPVLSGFPASVPFIVLFVLLVVLPKHRLVELTTERKPIVAEPRRLPPKLRIVGAVALVIVIARFPDLVDLRLPIYTTALAWSIVFLSIALLVRISGQVSLAQFGFAAVGAVASPAFADIGVPWPLAVVLGALVAVPVGAIVAIPAIRRSGLYLALATFGFAVLLEQLVYPTSWMFGGAASSVTAPRPSFATGDTAYFYVVVAFVTAAAALLAGVQRSRLGRLVRAMADSPTALNTYGASVTTLKVIVFCVGAFLAGVGGALVGPVNNSASPNLFNSFGSLQALVVFMIVVGGSVTVSLAAAFIMFVLPTYATGGDTSQYLTVLYGAVVIFVAMTRHRGMQAPRWLARMLAKRRPAPDRSPVTARLQPLAEGPMR